MGKTCDIVYVQAHWRGFASGAYPVLDYWRGNGSAYKGSHSPIRVAANYRSNLADKEEVPFESGSVDANGFTAKIRDAMRNVPTPHVFFSRLTDARIASKYKDSDLSWIDERERFVDTFMESKELDTVRKKESLVFNGLFVNKLFDESTVLHKTPKGSTVAVSEDGEIGCIAATKEDSYSERTLLGKAVSAGGCKTTAYEQDHDFYIRAGFVPVAWVHTEEKDYPAGFDPSKNFSCDQIVYLHATKCDPADVKMANEMTLDEWKKAVKPNRSIKDAENRRDDYMDGKKKIRYESTVNEEKEERRARRAAGRWEKPSLDTTLLIKRKKTKKADLPDTTNWADWEEAAEEMDDYEW